jgi:hypothetical protein
MGTVELLSEVRGPAPTDIGRRADDYWRFLERLLLGLVRYRDGAIRALGLPLIRTGPAELRDGAWVWRITGGLLTRRPGGEIGFGVRDGMLIGFLRGYRPLIPSPVYELTQKPVHQLITRLFLLHERGRRNPPGVPAEPLRRVAAGVLDAALLLAAAKAAGRARAAALGAAYLAASWSVTGQTVGDRLAGVRIVSSDGSRVTIGQALLRLAALPLACTGRARHDELAGTDAVRDR